MVLNMQNGFGEEVRATVKKIPIGRVATYKQIAKIVGYPSADRAVGTILGRNVDPEEVPCHRVVSSDGNLAGYSFGGIEVKKAILEKEGVRFVGNKVNLEVSQWEFLSR
jgi:methylated-DNA-protein-cysteine methyltransferase related protein